jgi:hypothetical protein
MANWRLEVDGQVITAVDIVACTRLYSSVHMTQQGQGQGQQRAETELERLTD